MSLLVVLFIHVLVMKGDLYSVSHRGYLALRQRYVASSIHL